MKRKILRCVESFIKTMSFLRKFVEPKYLIVIISVLMVISALLIVIEHYRRMASEQAPIVEVVKWDEGSDFISWVPTNHVSFDIQEEVLVVNITGFDPFFHSPPMINLSAEACIMRIRIAAVNCSMIKIYWIRADDLNWDESKAHLFPEITADGEFHTYTFDDLCAHPQWRGTVVQFRLDPEPADVGPAIWYIDYIAFCKRG